MGGAEADHAFCASWSLGSLPTDARCTCVPCLWQNRSAEVPAVSSRLFAGCFREEFGAWLQHCADHDPKPANTASCQAPPHDRRGEAYAQGGAWLTIVSCAQNEPKLLRQAGALLWLCGKDEGRDILSSSRGRTVRTVRNAASASPHNGQGAHLTGRHHVPSPLTHANQKAPGAFSTGPSNGARSGAAPSWAAPRQIMPFARLVLWVRCRRQRDVLAFYACGRTGVPKSLQLESCLFAECFRDACGAWLQQPCRPRPEAGKHGVLPGTAA